MMKFFKLLILIPKFSYFYAGELVMANFKMAKTVLSTRMKFKDSVVSLKAPLDKRSQVNLLMNLVTMTPGTISIDYNYNSLELTVHFMFEEDVEDLRTKLSTTYIPFLKELL